MKMIDSLGRTLSVDLVHKTESLIQAGKMMWTRPLEYNLEHSGTTYACLPYGAIGLRVMSKIGAELLVFQDGKLLIAAAIDKGVQYLERDSDGNLLTFKSPGDSGTIVSFEAAGFASEGIRPLALPPSDTTGGETDNQQEAKMIPNQPGLLFVVARLAKDPEIVGSQPPQIEYELEFQMNIAAAHYSALASSLSKMVVPALPPDCNDLLNLTPAQKPTTTFVCSCTGCKSSR